MDEAVLSFDDMSVWMESCALTGAAAFFAGLRGARHIEDMLWNGSVLRRELSVRAGIHG